VGPTFRMELGVPDYRGLEDPALNNKVGAQYYSGNGESMASLLFQVGSLRSITRIDAFDLLQKIAAVDQIMKLDGFGDYLVRFGLNHF